ncbi:MAG: aldo/keto reductase [Anaerolineales bacterium]|nr:aldo/keto reductase [Anaerolineales bacterium]
MQYKQLGQTDLNVSRLCLGTMTMGWTSDKKDSFAVMDHALENGINFFDTADVYSFWAKDNPGGVAETWIGEWLTERRARDKIIIATKARGRMWEGPDGEGLSRTHLLRAVEDSLRRLQVETIDLYQSHWPDENTPLEETFRAFEDMIQQGKVRYLGCSNHNAAQLQETLTVCAAHNLPRYESLQPHYNLVHRQEYEAELMALCQKENLGVIPYSSLQGGFLTGKYGRDGSAPEQSRGAGSERMRNYANELGFAILDALADMGRVHNAPQSQVALVWLLANPTITSAIIGANTVAQLADLIPAVELTLSVEEKKLLDHLKSPV